MRKIKILKINPATATPGSIEVQGNFVALFAGKFYRNEAGQTLPGYTVTPPAGYTLVVATNFDVIGNTKYGGRYTVYSPTGSTDSAAATFDSVNNKTTVRVNEVIQPLKPGDSVSVVSDGFVTNTSTYLLETAGPAIVVPPGITLTTYPLEIMGRNVTGWGEGYAQNFVNLLRNFANPNPPTNPLIGQSYYDTDDGQVRTWNGSAWSILNQASTGKTFKFTQSTASATWTINHGMELDAPFIALVQFYVDRGNGPKLIMPSDVAFTNANRIVVTFSNPEIGYAYIKS